MGYASTHTNYFGVFEGQHWPTVRDATRGAWFIGVILRVFMGVVVLIWETHCKSTSHGLGMTGRVNWAMFKRLDPHPHTLQQRCFKHINIYFHMFGKRDTSSHYQIVSSLNSNILKLNAYWILTPSTILMVNSSIFRCLIPTIYQWIGLRENLQESPIFNGKIYGFL